MEDLIELNVEVIPSKFQRIEIDGPVIAEGNLQKLDAIICTTGFDTSCRPRSHLVGDGGINLAELWDNSDDIEAYLAMAVPDFPNYLSEYPVTSEYTSDPYVNKVLVVIGAQCANF